MSDYVTPTITCGNFTKGKHYKIMAEELLRGRVLIEDDAGETAIVRIDGKPSSKLDYNGKFHRVSFETSDAISMSGVYRKEPIQNSEPFVFRGGRLYINKAKIGGAIMTSGALKPSGEDLVGRCERLQEQVNELIAANEEVRKILRCPDGFDIRKQAQVVRTLADTLLAISK
jgi:hypothetical protein